MLKKIVLKKYTEYQQLDAGKLMAVYSESNYENTDYFFPDETDKKAAVEKVEAGFLDFLKNDFFHKTEAAYWVLEADDIYVSALRTCKIWEGPVLSGSPGDASGFQKAGIRSHAAFRRCGFIEGKRSVPALQLRQQKEYRISENP